MFILDKHRLLKFPIFSTVKQEAFCPAWHLIKLSKRGQMSDESLKKNISNELNFFLGTGSDIVGNPPLRCILKKSQKTEDKVDIRNGNTYNYC